MTLDVMRYYPYAANMTQGPNPPYFRDKRTEQFANGNYVAAFSGFRKQAEKRLRILFRSESLDDLRALPSNHLEALGGDRRGQYSIRINLQWRICFEWPENAAGPCNLEIVERYIQ